jgi:hypothetical protein
VSKILIPFLIFAVSLEIEIVQNPIGSEFHLRGQLSMSVGIQLLELSLALIVFIQIVTLQSNPAMQFVDIDSELYV